MSFIFLFVFYFLTSFRASAQDPYHTSSFLHNVCPNTTLFSKNSTYFTNLKKLLSSLSSPNASYSTGFQNATAGQAPDRVTGIFLCRGDLSPEVCRNCVALSVQETLVRCPNGRESILYYEECMLRYSHQNILSTLTYNTGYYKLNPNNISSNQADRFQDLVSFTMNKAAVEAANSSRKFYTIKANWTAFQTLFVLVQCTPDLTRYECLRCLQKSISYNPLNIVGARLHTPSCSSRYELYAFYTETPVRTSPLPSSTSRVSFPPRPGKNGTTKLLAIAIFVAIILGVLLFIAGYLFHAKKKTKTSDVVQAFDGNEITSIESLQLDYRIIQAATNNYSESNKIGEGGYGEVYKGTLLNGAEVAVKRLSKSTGQGATDFMNEVVVVAKLQHKNLVRLLGFSLNREEKILVYEYVPNKSLDYFLFDHAKQGKLDWTKRYKIIEGISRGMLYLHHDSRLTVIHRDLKASNILLDVDMNPKIAKFGMARIFGLNQTQENTSRIVGTYGYMSPEYAMRGQFSIKSDVYSFGVLVLEILNGRKNNSFHKRDHAHDLLTYAWRLWIDGTALDLVDPIIFDNCKKSEMIRCIHIGLLCVQEDPLDRPTFSTILMMLTSYNMTLSVPQQPGFFSHCRPEQDPLDSNKSMMIMSVPGSIDDTSSSSKW